MNYNKIYNQIIERAKDRELECYTEKHHIIPCCMFIGGRDNPQSHVEDNTVKLTPEEHYVCHQLLVKMYPKFTSLLCAAAAMTMNRNGRPSNKRYGWLKRKHAKAIAIQLKHGPNSRRGKTMKDVTSNPDWTNPLKGMPMKDRLNDESYTVWNKGKKMPVDWINPKKGSKMPEGYKSPLMRKIKVCSSRGVEFFDSFIIARDSLKLSSSQLRMILEKGSHTIKRRINTVHSFMHNETVKAEYVVS
jgi:hypothetical protein